MKYLVTGYTRDGDGPTYPKGFSDADNLSEVMEHVAWALWVDKCTSVSVEESKVIE